MTISRTQEYGTVYGQRRIQKQTESLEMGGGARLTQLDMIDMGKEDIAGD